MAAHLEQRLADAGDERFVAALGLAAAAQLERTHACVREVAMVGGGGGGGGDDGQTGTEYN